MILERSGHCPFADDPEAVAGALVPTLRDRLSHQRLLIGCNGLLGRGGFRDQLSQATLDFG